jgi:RNase P/RNase MRP subunit p30
MMINEIFERTIRGASNRTTLMFFRLIQNKVEISYAKPRGDKILTRSNERVPEGNFVLLFRRAIYTRKNLRGTRGVRVTQRRDVVFVRGKTFKVNTYSSGQNKTTTRSNLSNMSH